MFGRRRPPVRRSGSTVPPRQVRPSSRPATFSYYSSDNTRQPGARPGTQASNSPARQAVYKRSLPVHRLRRLFRVSQLPLLVLVLVGLVSLIKISILSSDPKIVFLTPSGASTRYVQDNGVYTAAVSRQLKEDPLNRLKLTADVNGVQERLTKQFPELEAVSVDLPLLGNRPIAYLTIAAPSLDLAVSGQQFRLNNGGVVLARAEADGDTTLPVVTDDTGRLPTIGEQALPGSTVQFCTAVIYQLSRGQQTVSSLSLPAGAPFELDVRLKGKPYSLRFNLQADARQQSGAALAVIQKLGNAQPGQYIDLRVTGRAYYK